MTNNKRTPPKQTTITGSQVGVVGDHAQIKEIHFHASPTSPTDLRNRQARQRRALMLQLVHKFERLRVQQREAEHQSEHLFQTLLHRAFQGEL